MDTIIFYPVTLTLEFDPLFKILILANNFWTVKPSSSIKIYVLVILAIFGIGPHREHLCFTITSCFYIIKCLRKNMLTFWFLNVLKECMCVKIHLCSWYYFMIKVCVYFGTCTNNYQDIAFSSLLTRCRKCFQDIFIFKNICTMVAFL